VYIRHFPLAAIAQIVEKDHPTAMADFSAAGGPRLFDSTADKIRFTRVGRLTGTELIELNNADFKDAGTRLLLTDHDLFDCERTPRLSRIVIDTYNATTNLRANRQNIVLA
jgi:hypothetical protein